MAAAGLRRQGTRLAQQLQNMLHPQWACRGAAARISTTSGDPSAQREAEIAQLLRDKMPGARAVRVQDTSGGCGSMYRIEVAAAEFKCAGENEPLTSALMTTCVHASARSIGICDAPN